MGLRADLRLWERAMNQRWPIKDQYRDAMIRRVVQIIADPSSTKREVATASRVLLAAEAQNQTDERAEDDTIEQGNRFLEIAAGLGITTSIERIAEGGSGDSPATIDADGTGADNAGKE